MTNFDLCENLFSVLHQLKVESIVVCAGARNAALVMNLEKQKFNKIFYFEERSAAFFALGLMKKAGHPVAIITTSGTAAAELLPATIESYYQGLPLILITADRPKSYRGTGAPQTINQTGLFSNFIEQTFDWDLHQANFNFTTSLNKPIHFNLCFDEPLVDQASGYSIPIDIKLTMGANNPMATAADFTKIEKPLVIVGEFDKKQRTDVIEFLSVLQAPIYLESLSELKNEAQINKLVVRASETLVTDLFKAGDCRSVIRIGSVPTLRFWRDLETQFKNISVINFTRLPFSGLARPSTTFDINFKNAQKTNSNSAAAWINEKDLALQQVKQDLFKKYPIAEQSCVRKLSGIIQSEPIYLGNSLPIREWDLFASTPANGIQPVYANRGANGIDGQISTYLGWSHGTEIAWCLVGDLTAMYDLAALGLAVETSKPDKKRLVVINNFGGQIFKRVFKNENFVNPHCIEFEALAKMWSWDYIKIRSENDFNYLATLKSEKVLFEIQPDALQTEYFWNAWDLACQKT